MRNQTVLISNVTKLVTAYQEVNDQSPSLPRLLVTCGHAGTGKTKAVSYLANCENPVHLTANRFWTPNYMLRAIISELGGKPSNANGIMFDKIARLLREQGGRGVIIDEFDCFFGNKRELELIDGLRQLHDAAGTTFVLVGEHQINLKIAKYERLEGRVSRWINFEAIDRNDAVKLAKALVEDCTLEPALIDRLLAQSRGLVREYCVLLNRAEQVARQNGLKTVSLEWWTQTVRDVADKQKEVA